MLVVLDNSNCWTKQYTHRNYMLVLIKHTIRRWNQIAGEREREKKRIWNWFCSRWSRGYVPTIRDFESWHCYIWVWCTFSFNFTSSSRSSLSVGVWSQMLPFDCDNNLLCACNYYYYGGIVSLFCSMVNGTHDNIDRSIDFGQSLSSP